MEDETCTEVYRLHVWICRISPMIWRRLLVRSDSSIAHLHYTLQTAFGWSDEHLHRFHIHGQDYGVSRAGGIMFTADSSAVRLCNRRRRRIYSSVLKDILQAREVLTNLASRLPGFWGQGAVANQFRDTNRRPSEVPLLRADNKAPSTGSADRRRIRA
jgi:hypothetical protein